MRYNSLFVIVFLFTIQQVWGQTDYASLLFPDEGKEKQLFQFCLRQTETNAESDIPTKKEIQSSLGEEFDYKIKKDSEAKCCLFLSLQLVDEADNKLVTLRKKHYKEKFSDLKNYPDCELRFYGTKGKPLTLFGETKKDKILEQLNQNKQQLILKPIFLGGYSEELFYIEDEGGMIGVRLSFDSDDQLDFMYLHSVIYDQDEIKEKYIARLLSEKRKEAAKLSVSENITLEQFRDLKEQQTLLLDSNFSIPDEFLVLRENASKTNGLISYGNLFYKWEQKEDGYDLGYLFFPDSSVNLDSLFLEVSQIEEPSSIYSFLAQKSRLYMYGRFKDRLPVSGINLTYNEDWYSSEEETPTGYVFFNGGKLSHSEGKKGYYYNDHFYYEGKFRNGKKHDSNATLHSEKYYFLGSDWRYYSNIRFEGVAFINNKLVDGRCKIWTDDHLLWDGDYKGHPSGNIELTGYGTYTPTSATGSWVHTGYYIKGQFDPDRINTIKHDGFIYEAQFTRSGFLDSYQDTKGDITVYKSGYRNRRAIGQRINLGFDPVGEWTIQSLQNGTWQTVGQAKYKDGDFCMGSGENFFDRPSINCNAASASVVSQNESVTISFGGSTSSQKNQAMNDIFRDNVKAQYDREKEAKSKSKWQNIKITNVCNSRYKQRLVSSNIYLGGVELDLDPGESETIVIKNGLSIKGASLPSCLKASY